MKGSPFNVSALAEALRRRLSEAFEPFRLANQNPDKEPLCEPNRVMVYLDDLPTRERDLEDQQTGPQFPLVLIETPKWIDESGDGGEKKTTVFVHFQIGVRRLNAEGAADVRAIAEHIRTNLLRVQLIENGARLELPLETEIGKQDDFPHWVGVVSARFNIPQPVEEISYE